MKPKSVKQVGFVLVSSRLFDVRRNHLLDRPDESGMVLDTVPLTPEARDAFTPAELEERLARIADRVAREQPDEPAVVCGGCGVVPPKLTYVRSCPGWVVEEIPGCGTTRPIMVLWCPQCAAAERAGG